MKHFNTLLLSASVVTLAACGGGGGTVSKAPTISAEEEAARVFSKNIGDAGDALSDGMTLSARQLAMAGITLDYNDSGPGNTEITDMTEFTVRINAEGEVTFVMEGTEYAFVPADRLIEDGGEVYGYSTDAQCDAVGVCVNLFNFTGEIDDLKTNGHGYSEILNSQSNQIYGEGGLNLRAYAVIGTETMDSDLGSLGSATYSGRARLDAYPATGFEDNGASRTRVRSDVMMMADFGAGAISGTMDSFTIQDPGMDEVSYGGSVAMNKAPFAVNGFRGGLTPDATWTASTGLSIDGTSTYSGAFYGPNAEEVSGVFNVTGVGDDGDFNAVGFFTADQ